MSALARLELDNAARADLPPLAVRRVHLVVQDGRHTVAKVDVYPVSRRADALRVGDPVILTWGRAVQPVTSVFYVHEVEAASERRSGDPAPKVTLVGASWPMKNEVQRVLSNVTVEQALADFTRRHHLHGVVQAPERTLDVFVSRRSDWQGVNDLASRVGAMVRSEGVTIRLLGRETGLRNLSRAPVFSSNDFSFSGVVPTLQAAGSRARRVSMVDPVTKKVVTVTDTPEQEGENRLLVSRPAMVAGSVRELRDDLMGLRLAERFTETAEVSRLPGDPRLRVGDVVGFSGLGAPKDGYWTITKAVHEVTQDTFVSALSLGRGPNHPRTASPLTPTVTTGAPPDGVFPSLRDGKWVA